MRGNIQISFYAFEDFLTKIDYLLFEYLANNMCFKILILGPKKG